MLVWFTVVQSFGYEAKDEAEALKKFMNEDEPDGETEADIISVEIEDDEEED